MSTGARRIGRKDQQRFDPSVPLPNKRHEDFVQGLFHGMNASDAYRAAGYKPSKPEYAWTEAHRLSRHPKVAPRLSYLRAQSADESILTKAWLIEQTRETYMEARAVGHHSAALKALAMLGLERGTFIPKQEYGRPGDFSEMAIDELRAFVEREMAAIGGSGPMPAPKGRSNGSGGQLH